MRLALLLLVGCGRVAFDPLADAGGDAGGALPEHWGDYAATLPVPECTGEELLVTDTTDALDGGVAVADPASAGPTLSFVEALVIAKNRAGRDVIRFDAAVFPVDAPSTIVIGPAAMTPTGIQDACIDGRRRGVIVDWDQCSTVLCPPELTTNSLLIGLTYINTTFEMGVNDSQVAGVRFGTDGTANLEKGRPWSIEIDGALGTTAQIGPGNVIAANNYAFRVFGGEAVVTIHDNFIGFDPLTRQVIGPIAYAFDLRAQGTAQMVTIANNVIAASASVVQTASPVGYTTHFATNWFGTDERGEPLPGTWAGLTLLNSTWRVIGNTFENVGIAITIDVANVLAYGNRIANSAGAIEYTTAPPISPPAITSATASTISGSCVTGTNVSIFADPGALAAQHLGETACTAGAFTVTGSYPAGLNALATQSTSTSTSELSAPVLIQ